MMSGYSFLVTLKVIVDALTKNQFGPLLVLVAVVIGIFALRAMFSGGKAGQDDYFAEAKRKEDAEFRAKTDGHGEDRE